MTIILSFCFCSHFWRNSKLKTEQEYFSFCVQLLDGTESLDKCALLYKLYTLACERYFKLFLCGLDFLTFFTYRIGEIFIHLSSEEIQEYLEKAKSKLQEEMKSLESQSGEIKGVLGDLKVKLYAKFGNNINLEAEEE